MPNPDLSEFFEHQDYHTPRCSVPAALGQLAKGDREKAEAAMNAQAIHATSIARWLEQRGVIVQGQTIARHRRGACTCDRRPV